MKISGLFVHPLKSGRAVPVAGAGVSAMGLEGDRRFMLVDAAGRFVSQREVPALARIVALMVGECLSLSLDGWSHVVLPRPDAPRLDVAIWEHSVSAAHPDPEADAGLSERLGVAVRLVQFDHLSARIANPDWAGPGTPVGFADGYQILVTTTGALAALNRTLAAEGRPPVGMERFRPNIVIDADGDFPEDGWSSIRIGAVTLDLVKPCPRCVMTTIDQDRGVTGEADPMPALRALRLSADRRATGVMFGWNAVPRSAGVVALGDPVTILGRRPEGWAFRQRG